MGSSRMGSRPRRARAGGAVVSVHSIVHNSEGLARPCSATDLFIISGGLQCGNCLAHNVKPYAERMCIERTHEKDGSRQPCPLPVDHESGRCWIHEQVARGSEAPDA